MPLFIKQIRNGQKITITDSKMTRFSITMNEALDFILESTMLGRGSEVFIPKLKAYSIMDLKHALFELLGKTGEINSGIRFGEKLHESLINQDELRYTWELDNKFVILQSFDVKNREKKIYTKIKKAKLVHAYSSDNVEKISKEQLKEIISLEILPKLKSLNID